MSVSLAEDFQSESLQFSSWFHPICEGTDNGNPRPSISIFLFAAGKMDWNGLRNVWAIRLHFMRLCTTPTLLVVMQRVTRSSTASPTSPTRMSGSGSRNGSWWTCRLSTTEWGWPAPCGSCPLSTSTTRSAYRRLYVEVVLLFSWYGHGTTLFCCLFFFLPFFKGERHVPCRPVCT